MGRSSFTTWRSRLHQHVLFAVEEDAGCVNVISDDADVFVLLTHFFHLKQPSATIIMESAKEEWNIIDIGQTAIKYCDILTNVLAGHALYGCDSVPQMFNIGKKTVFKKLSEFPLTKLIGTLPTKLKRSV